MLIKGHDVVVRELVDSGEGQVFGHLQLPEVLDVLIQVALPRLQTREDRVDLVRVLGYFCANKSSGCSWKQLFVIHLEITFKMTLVFYCLQIIYFISLSDENIRCLVVRHYHLNLEYKK